MPRHFIKRYTPDPASLKKHKYLRHLGALLHDEPLAPEPPLGGRRRGNQAVLGDDPHPRTDGRCRFSAVVFRVNLPISVALVWLTNPFTMPPVFYFSYLVGTWIWAHRRMSGEFQLSLEWIASELNSIWKPLYLGSLVLGILLGVSGYCAMRLYWRWHVLQANEGTCRQANYRPPVV